MNALVFDRHFVLPRPGALLLRAGFGVVMPLVLAGVLAGKGVGLAVPLFCALFAVGHLALAVTTAHKEILAAGPSFFHARLRRKVWSAQLAWALGEALVVSVLAAVAYPGAGPAVLVSAFGAALVVHALAALATLRLTWSYLLPVWSYYLFFAVRRIGLLEASGHLAPVQQAYWAWLAGASVLLWWLARDLRRPDLHRRLCGSIVLGPDDLLRPSRMTEYRRQGDHRRGQLDGPHWRTWLIGSLIGRAGAASQAGRTITARAWQMAALDAAVNVSARRRVLVVTSAMVAVSMVVFGYYDSLGRMGRLDGWFAGLTYQGAALPFWSLGVAMLTSQHAAVSRRSAFLAEVSLVWRAMAFALAASIVLTGVFALLEAVLPDLTWRGQELEFTAPGLHGIWLVPLLGPVAWLSVAVRPRPHCSVTNFALSLGFMAGHFLMSSVPYASSAPIWIGVSAVSFVLAFLLRRRWWERADLSLA